MLKLAIGFLIVDIIVTCLVGACAALCGLSAVEKWAERRLNDTDGQPANETAD